MWKTVLRRVLLMIPQMFILSILIFLLAKMMPGDPFTGLITPTTDPSVIEELREKAGLNDPWYQQYWHWITNAVHGDFGTSYIHKVDVADIIGERAGNTVWLAILTLVFTYAIAIPLGLLAGRYKDSWFDRFVSVYNYTSFAIPVFVLALLTLWIFGYLLGWFPTSGSVSIDVQEGTFGYYFNRFYHMLLPALVGAVLQTAVTIQYLRNEVIDAGIQDYVRTARAKGVPENAVYNRHIFRNASLPIVSNLNFEVVELIAGSIYIESVFSYPGIGKLFIESLTGRDYSVITALILILGLASLIGTLISDIIMSIVDPRIRIK